TGVRMGDRRRRFLLCSCEGTVPLDAESARRACRASDVSTAHQLCRAELDRFREAVAAGAPLTVGCTQEAPLFDEIATEIVGASADICYANIRETAGWSRDAPQAAPKMAALLAMAAEPLPDIPYVSLKSEGTLLVYG